MKKIGEEIKSATKDLKGKKVNVEINLKSNKKCDVRVVDTGEEIAHKLSEERSDQVQKVYSLNEGKMDL